MHQQNRHRQGGRYGRLESAWERPPRASRPPGLAATWPRGLPREAPLASCSGRRHRRPAEASHVCHVSEQADAHFPVQGVESGSRVGAGHSLRRQSTGPCFLPVATSTPTARINGNQSPFPPTTAPWLPRAAAPNPSWRFAVPRDRSRKPRHQLRCRSSGSGPGLRPVARHS